MKKRCTICGETKLYEYFSKNIKSPNGHRPDCKQCCKLSLETRINMRKESLAKISTKLCKKCGKEKNKDNFHSRCDGRIKLAPYCKPCQKIVAKANKAKHNHYKDYELKRTVENPERRAKEHFKSKVKQNYGINYEEYEELLKKHNYKCAICQSNSSENNKKLHLDHCHETGKIRGFLCRACNHGLGNFKDDIDLLEKAKEYLTSENNKQEMIYEYN